MEKTALLVVDMQTALVQTHPYNEENLVNTIQQLIGICRMKNIEVIYVRHDGGAGSELERNTDGWQIYHEIQPQNEEVIFEKKYNSAFKDTGLNKYLDSKGIKNLILVGMQTEYCIDCTCKVAFEYGYNVMIPKQATSTYDNPYLTGKDICAFYADKIWNNRYAKVMSKEELQGVL